MQTKKYSSDKFSQQIPELLLILLTVSLFYLAFPTGGYSQFTWFVLIPVFIALKNQSTRQAFTIGFLAAILGWVISIWWVVPGLSIITSSSNSLVIPFVLLYCCLSALPYGIGCFLHVYLHCGKSVFGAFLSALIFTILVNYTPQILPGNLAHALYQDTALIQAADIGGVAFVFFIIHSVNFLLANAITIDNENKNQKLLCILLAIFIFCANYFYGNYKIDSANSINDNQQKIVKIAMVQPNISIKNRTREDWQRLAPELLVFMENISKGENIDLIILPELPVPISYQNFDFDHRIFHSLAANSNLLLTAIQPLNNQLDEQNGYFNTMELIKKNEPLQQYAKQVLLPFGEYLPFEETFPWLRVIFPYAPNYKQGDTSLLFDLPLSNASLKIVPLICYEAVFPNITREGVEAGGEMLINTSNDAWFGESAGQKVHLALSTFRSVEYRKVMVRNTNNGISVIIDPYGRQIESSKIEPYTRGYSVTSVNINAIDSFHQQYPFFIKWLLLILTAVVISIKIRMNAKYVRT